MEVPALPRALVRVPPVAGELTGSWSRRLAHGYHMSVQDLVRGIMTGPQSAGITGTPRNGLELYLNTPARAAFARFTGTSVAQLAALLPGLASTHERLTEDSVPRAAWYAPAKAWVAACLQCCGRFWSPHQPVLVYPEAAGHICHRHRRWLLANCERACAIDLESLPEVLSAHGHHTALLRTHRQARAVVNLAAAVVWSWQVQGWQQEAVWHARTALLSSLTGRAPAAVAAHALITYPDTVTVARLLVDHGWQVRLREAVTAYGAPAATGLLLTELGRRTGRLWLGDWLAACSRAGRWPGNGANASALLEQWVARLGATDGTEQPADAGLWAVPLPARRPVEYGERTTFLIDSRSREATEEAGKSSLTGGWEPS
ncbi:TniQ family protein [Streptomyces sp. NPDC005803]|uniref:TniQ family protein n=1 Tax=Streptomyces sp. NPDC005803 TaxID=3154297 RepID=UPI0033FEC0A9